MASKKKNVQTPQKQKLSKKTKRIIVVSTVITMAVLLIAGILLVLFDNGIIGNSEKYKKMAADRKTVATCNGFEIPYEELLHYGFLQKIPVSRLWRGHLG